MTEIEINKVDDKAEVILEGEKLGDFDGQQLWDLSEELRDYALSNPDGFLENAEQTISIKDVHFKVHPLNHPEFWDLVNKGDWEPETYAVFDQYITADTIFLDVGAWIGSTALYGVQRAAETHAFEPDPIAFEELKANRASNADREWFSKLHVYQKALSTNTGTAYLGSKNEGGDSMSSLLFGEENQSWKVTTIDLQTFLKDKKLEKQPMFLKMDIEGGEYDLIPAISDVLKDSDTTLLLSLHPEFLIEEIRKNTKGSFKELKTRFSFYQKHRRLLKGIPYRNIRHIDGRQIHVRKQLLKALFLGHFPHNILAFS